MRGDRKQQRDAFTADDIERLARVYRTNADAARAIGIRSNGFGRLCRRFGVVPPSERNK